jgi:hypothetical protein
MSETDAKDKKLSKLRSGLIYSGEGIEIRGEPDEKYGQIISITVTYVDSGIEEFATADEREAAKILVMVGRPDLIAFITD